jgi:hypothetical protein
MKMHQIFLVSLLLSFSVDAAAYLDPGTGSIILQGVIAAVAVAGLTIKTYWYRILAFFGKGSPKSLLDDDDDTEFTEEK